MRFVSDIVKNSEPLNQQEQQLIGYFIFYIYSMILLPHDILNMIVKYNNKGELVQYVAKDGRTSTKNIMQLMNDLPFLCCNPTASEC